MGVIPHLMVVNYFDMDGVPLLPLKTDAPLVVNPNAVLSLPIT